ncbi:hypothetical protein AHAS_Ahas19G0155600 [Arachis hypogaea]
MDFRSFNIHLKETSGLGGGKKRIYATVSMVGGSSPKQKASIENHIPKFGSSSIRSCFLRFYVENTKLQYNQLVLMIQILQKRILRCDKVIGEVCVSLKELYDVFTTNFGFQPIVMVKTLGNNNKKKKKTVPQVTAWISPGMVPEEESMNMDDIDEESPDPEDRWYKDDLEDRPFDLCPTIPVSKEEFEDWCKLWRNALIIKFLGKRVGLAFLEQRLQRDWVKKGMIHVIDMDCDYFLIHFSDEEDYSHALLEGPWMIAGHYLIVQRWRPFFLKSEHHVRKIAVWVRIPNLPIELYNYRFLWRIGSAIGHMLKIDRNTSIHSRGRFARICVEIDLAKKLVPRISVLGSELNIE